MSLWPVFGIHFFSSLVKSIFRQKPISELFASARENNVALIVRLPLASGLLAGKFTRDATFPVQDHRNFNRDGQAFNVGETFADGKIRLARDVPVGTPTWKRFYHRARNAVESRNANLEAWDLKRLPVYGQPRGRAFVALADTWINLTTLGRLVREATFASHTQLN